MEAERRTPVYDLFLRLAKTLALKLPLHKHRILAAKWIRKIDNLIDANLFEKTRYLELINIAMQSKTLVGPFLQEPAKEDCDMTGLYRLRPADIRSMVVDSVRFRCLRPNPYFVEISGDLKEYLVYQEINDFGSHFYYACSTDPITTWNKNKFTILPNGALESSIMVPPIPEISKTKDDYLSLYKLYMKNFKNHKTKKCRPKRKPKTNKTPDCDCPIPDCPISDCSISDGEDDSASDYVDYQLIGQGESAAKSPLPQSVSQHLIDGELPTKISFYVGDDPEPFYYQLAVDQCRKGKKSSNNDTKKEKIKALACEYLTLGVVECETDALLKAKEFLARVGCI